MPELPDLEVFAKNLRPKILNKKVSSIKVIKEKVLKKTTTPALTKLLVGQKISQISRRGKMLIFKLSNQKVFLVHLMLHGELYWNKSTDPVQEDWSGQNYLFYMDYYCICP